jgi:hypothetical protein
MSCDKWRIEIQLGMGGTNCHSLFVLIPEEQSVMSEAQNACFKDRIKIQSLELFVEKSLATMCIEHATSALETATIQLYTSLLQREIHALKPYSAPYPERFTPHLSTGLYKIQMSHE